MSAPLGEFGRIARFFAPLAGPGGLGLTDDAAVLGCLPGHRLVLTADAMVAGVHYLPDDPPDLVARKLLRTNLSDLAAMGARPLHYLLTSALPKELGDDWVERFAAGLAEDQERYGVTLLGGDSVSTPGPASLSLTAIGEVRAGAEIRRNGARPGDHIWVSGTIGDAHLGLQVLRGGFPDLPENHRAVLAARFQLPEPRTGLGPCLAGIAHAMCDVSDGLLADLGHICDTSGCAATVTLPSVPLSEAAQHVLAQGNTPPVSLVTGGDDYELLFTAPPEMDDEIEEMAAELALRVTTIGTIETGAGVRLVDGDGNTVPVTAAGYRHF